MAQEIYDKNGDKSEQPKFFGAYEKHLKGKVQYTDEKIAEKKEDEENSLLFYLNEYRNAISHRETPGKLISVFLPEGITKYKPHKFNKTTKQFDSPWNDMTWNKLLDDIFKMTIKIKDECYASLS
ncbi:MAG: hypothetical protein MUO82_04850 [Candidatus Thermoplasmatota archaeon]|nr:hypothetical protein [Candidatus Thermoplasmatota archaeon]